MYSINLTFLLQSIMNNTGCTQIPQIVILAITTFWADFSFQTGLERSCFQDAELALGGPLHSHGQHRFQPRVPLRESFEAARLFCKDWFSYSQIKILVAERTQAGLIATLSASKRSSAWLCQPSTLQRDPELGQGAGVDVVMKSEQGSVHIFR